MVTQAIVEKLLSDAKELVYESYSKAYDKYERCIHYIVVKDMDDNIVEQGDHNYCEVCIDIAVEEYKKINKNKHRKKTISYEYSDPFDGGEYIDNCDNCGKRFTNSIYIGKYCIDNRLQELLDYIDIKNEDDAYELYVSIEALENATYKDSKETIKHYNERLEKIYQFARHFTLVGLIET